MSPDPFWFDDSEDLDPLFSSPKKPTDSEIQQILDRFIAQDLTDAEAEAALERMSRSRKQVCPFIWELCRSTDPTRYSVGSILVIELNLTELREPLRKLIKGAEIDDKHKMRLLAALEAVGGLRPGEDPMTFLHDPEAAARDARETFVAILQDPVQLSQMLEDDLVSDGGNILNPATIAVMAASRDRRLMPLLLCLLHAPQDALVLAAIEGLGTIGDAAALAALEERAEWDASAKVRRAARRVATELKASLTETSTTIFELPVAPPPVQRCLLSTIDGVGGQMLLVIRQSPNGERTYLDVMFDDQVGIKDCFGGRSETQVDLEDELLQAADDHGFDVVDVTLSHVRAELERAYQTTLKARRRAVPTYPAWRDWLCGEDDRPLEFHPLPSLTAAEMTNLLPRCVEVLDLPEFVSWHFESRDLSAYERRYRKLLNRPGTDEAIEAVIGEAIALKSQPDWCALVKNRLERQAWLLAQLYEDEEIPKLALAAAYGLDPASGVRPTDHPLVREMMRRTLSGPLVPF